MENEKKLKKRMTAPHPYVILLGIILLLAVLTYIIPAGTFDRVQNEAGMNLVVPGTFHYTESHPTNFLSIPQLVMRGIVKNVNMVANVLLVGGAFQMVIDTGALLIASQKLAYRFRTRKYLVICIITTMFALVVTFSGAVTAIIPFIPVSLILCKSLKFEKVTAIAIVMLGGYMGYTAGITSANNVGSAQLIAELPLYSGMGMRVALLVITVITSCAYMIWYEKRVSKNPLKSVFHGIDDPDWNTPSGEVADVKMTTRQIIVLVVMMAFLGVMIYGLIKWNWDTVQSTGILILMGIVCAVINGTAPNQIAKSFDEGIRTCCGTAIVIGVASGVSLILSDASILDTIINALASVVNHMPSALKGVAMFLTQSLINFMITSGSGQAAATMPIMTPVADLVGISRQSAVLAFQMGDGFSNAILPWAGATAGMVGLANCSFSAWFKYILPLFLIWTAEGMVLMGIATMIGY